MRQDWAGDKKHCVVHVTFNPWIARPSRNSKPSPTHKNRVIIERELSIGISPTSYYCRSDRRRSSRDAPEDRPLLQTSKSPSWIAGSLVSPDL